MLGGVLCHDVLVYAKNLQSMISIFAASGVRRYSDVLKTPPPSPDLRESHINIGYSGSGEMTYGIYYPEYRFEPQVNKRENFSLSAPDYKSHFPENFPHPVLSILLELGTKEMSLVQFVDSFPPNIYGFHVTGTGSAIFGCFAQDEGHLTLLCSVSSRAMDAVFRIRSVSIYEYRIWAPKKPSHIMNLL